MKKFFILVFSLLALNTYADGKHVTEITMDRVLKRGDRTEVTAEPQVSYDDESNTVEVAIEADRYFEMKVIDISGTVVFTCPVIMVDGTPANYQLPELPAGIYTLKVESPEVAFEGTLVIE